MFFFKKNKLSNMLFEKIDKAFEADLEMIGIANKRICMIRHGDNGDLLTEFDEKIAKLNISMSDISNLKDLGARIRKRDHKNIIESHLNNVNKLASDLADNLHIDRDNPEHGRILVIVNRTIRRHLEFIQLIYQVKGDY